MSSGTHTLVSGAVSDKLLEASRSGVGTQKLVWESSQMWKGVCGDRNILEGW